MRVIHDIKGARAEVRAKVSILRVVTDDMGPAPKQTGQDHMWCCPFHGEKSPSFGVHDEMGIFKCFGCQVGGDVVTWTQMFMGVSTAEALEMVSIRYALDLSAYEREPTPEEKLTEKYFRVQDELARQCSKNLFANKQVLDWFVSDTGFSLEQIADYDVGYSLSPDTNTHHLYDKFSDLSQHDVEELEISRKLMWTNAIVYPIRNAAGRTTRFYNKPLTPPADMVGKYLGTSHEHPLFTHRLLYGFSLVRKDIKKKNGVIRVVEGQKAAIASGGVAMLGSSMHKDQIELLKEYGVKEAIVCFDGDDAGRSASLRFMDDVPDFGDVNVLIAKMPDGEQPDDVAKVSVQALDQIFLDAKIPVEYYVDTKRQADGSINEADKNRIVRDLKTYLSKLPDIHMEMAANFLSRLLDVDASSVKGFVSEMKMTSNSLVNRDVEISVLKNCVLTPAYFSTLKQAVESVKVFTLLPHQKVFECVDLLAVKLRETSGMAGITPQAIKDELGIRYPQYKDLPAYVDVLLGSEAKYEFYDALTRMVDLYRRREALDQSRIFMAFMQDLTKNTGEVVSKYRRQLVSTIDVRKDQASTPTQLSSMVAKELEARSMRQNVVIGHDFSVIRDVDGENIPCLPGLTYAMQGLQKQHQFIISANSGVGKSLIALQMATAISVCPDPADRVPVLWIPLEMNATEITMRQISLLSGVDNNKVQAGNFTKEEKLRVDKALHMISEGKLYMQKPRFGSSEELFSIIDEYKFKYGIEAVFLDYIQMVGAGDGDRGASREEVIGKCSKMMKLQVAEAMRVVSVCVAQQNRQNFKQGETTKIESVGGSYQVAQDADDFFTMSEKTEEQMTDEKNARGNRRGFLDKRRGGASDVMLDLNLDTVGCSLRFRETITPGQMYGIMTGAKS